MTHQKFILLVALLLGSMLSSQAEVYWSQFRGPNGQGTMEEARPPVHLDPDKNLAWRTKLPPGHSSPVVWGNRIFLTAFEDGRLITFGLERYSGRVLWKDSVAYEPFESSSIFGKSHEDGSPASATVCADEEGVYSYFLSFGVVCYSHDGIRKWQTRVPTEEFFWNSGASPVVHQGKVFVVRDLLDRKKSHLLALDAKTGAEKWRTARPFSMASFSTPAVFEVGGSRHLVVLGVGDLHAYDVETGLELWSVAEVGTAAISVPLIDRDRVFINAKAMIGFDVEYDFAKAWEYFLTFDANKNSVLELSEITEEFRLPQRPELPVESKGFGNRITRERMEESYDGNKDGQITFDEFTQGMQARLNDLKATLACIQVGREEGNTPKAAVLWSQKRFLAEVPSILLYRKNLYSIDNGGLYVIRNPADGEVVQRERLQARGMYASSPVAANGHVYFASKQGVVSVLKAEGDFEIVSSVNLNELIYATPAIQDHSIYIRTDSHLYGFQSSLAKGDLRHP